MFDELGRSVFGCRNAPGAPREEIDAQLEAVGRNCPILNLLRNPQTIRAEVKLVNSRANARERDALAAA